MFSWAGGKLPLSGTGVFAGAVLPEEPELLEEPELSLGLPESAGCANGFPFTATELSTGTGFRPGS